MYVGNSSSLSVSTSDLAANSSVISGLSIYFWRGGTNESFSLTDVLIIGCPHNSRNKIMVSSGPTLNTLEGKYEVSGYEPSGHYVISIYGHKAYGSYGRFVIHSKGV